MCLLYFLQVVEMFQPKRGYNKSNFTIKISFLTLIGLTNSIFGAEKCPKESSNITDSRANILWVSKGIQNEIVTSLPLCVDVSGNLMVRVCQNPSWSPKEFDACPEITARRRCPMNFLETSDSCTFISPPRSWGNICSFEGMKGISEPAILNYELIWLPYKRLIEYGPYESVTFGEKRGHVFDKPINGSLADQDFFNKDCLVMNITTKESFPEFCHKEHRHVCVFGKEEANSRCPEGCISADIVSRKCYCKRKGSCGNLSKIQTVFDLTVLSDLVDGDECYVDSDLVPKMDLKQALTGSSWFYTGDNLDCSLCSTQFYKSTPQEEVEMVLNFDDKQNQLFLTIYSPDSLHDGGNEDFVYCYTNAAKYDLTKRLKIEKIIEYRQGAAYNVYEIELEKFIGTYWCEAFKDSNDDKSVKSNHVLAYKEKNGNEFSVRLMISSICILFPCDQEYMIDYEKILEETSLSNLEKQVRVMEIISFDFKSIDILLHITTENQSDVLDDYKHIKEQLEKIQTAQIRVLKSSEYCLPEISHNLTWPLTKIGQGAVPKESCLQKDGLPVVRVCGGKFLYGGEWKEILGECEKDVQVPDSTEYIKSTLEQNLTDETVANVTTVIKSDPDLPVITVYYVSKFLSTMYNQMNNSRFDAINSTLDITDSLLDVNKETLMNAQAMLNVTDDLLDLFDDIMIDSTVDTDVMMLQKENIIIHVTNPLLSGISGIAVYEDGGIKIENLARNSSLQDLGPNVLVAMVVPEEILNHRNTSNITIVTAIYFKRSFFESNYTKQPSGPVISISIPEFGCYLPSTIPVLFKTSNSSDLPECGFWDYGKKASRYKGHWSTVGGNYLGEMANESHYHICAYSHLTHFSLLRLTVNGNFTEFDENFFDVIFYIGDALTVIGVCGIFVTAVMFKRWRKKQGTVILLNLTVAILLEELLMQISTTKITFAPQGCTVLGILLHYTIISKFCWMLVYSFLQYMRFVKVLSVLPENVVIRSVIFGWGTAIIPVAIVSVLDSDTYIKKKYNFCYPSGNYLYLGVMMPILIIVLINTCVFVVVMREVTSNKVESHGNKDNIHKLQLQLAILLFFVLGVPWLFWVFANLISVSWIQTTMAYLFYITSNIQGFVLFLFYVVFNPETRNAWMGYIKKKAPVSVSVSTKFSSRS